MSHVLHHAFRSLFHRESVRRVGIMIRHSLLASSPGQRFVSRYDPVHNKHYLRWTWHPQGKDNYIAPIVIKVKFHHGECCQAQAQPSSRQKIIKRRYCHGKCERKNDIRAEAQKLCFWSMLQLYSSCVFDSRWQVCLLDILLCWPLFLVPLLSNIVLCSLMLVSHQILLTLGWFNCVRIPKHFKCLMLCRIYPSRWITNPSLVRTASATQRGGAKQRGTRHTLKN